MRALSDDRPALQALGAGPGGCRATDSPLIERTACRWTCPLAHILVASTVKHGSDGYDLGIRVPGALAVAEERVAGFETALVT